VNKSFILLIGSLLLARSVLANDAQRIAFCGTYIRENGFCGSHIPQESLLEKEFIALDEFQTGIYQRTPYGIVTTYGVIKAAIQVETAPQTRVFWFEDRDGNIRNVNTDINLPYTDMYIQRKGTAQQAS
jgi:hypothetical protein